MFSNNPITQILDKYPVMVLDGAMATELERHGHNLNDKLWSAKVLLENPQTIYDVHYDYFKAGADCATTCSYQASIEGFAQRGIYETEARKLIRKTVELAQQARADFIKQEGLVNRPQPLVAASIGPYGAFMADGSEYRGNYGVSAQVLHNFHQTRIEVVLDAGADLLAFETMPSKPELEVLLELLAQYPQAHAWFSLSVKDPEYLCDGTALSECARFLSQSEQVAAIGVNCTALENVSPVIRTLKTATDKPILVYPNSGEVYDAVTKTWHGGCSCHEGFSTLAKQWVQDGARLIGGCCRTTPTDIAQVVSAVRG